ncbi:PfkB family carbohydrate kinase [Alphaproteobacteria bacterium]|nr:PfkB family carbohydrate kinase [Alphaproteobacteria bacterium]
MQKKTKIPVIVDPNGSNYIYYSGCTVVTPNRYELALASGENFLNEESITNSAKKLLVNTKIENILVTKSEKGMSLINKNGDIFNLESQAKEVFDVSGAGDTVAAVLGGAYSISKDLKLSAFLSNIAAGIVVSKVGTAVVNSEELINGLKGIKKNKFRKKILDDKNAVKLINKWKGESKKIAFTNGVFDLLHAGHIHSIKQAKKKCDRLVVGLNSDSSVKKIKGESRPIQNEFIRAEIIASLNEVDIVVIFSETEPLSLIKKIIPHVLVKGAEYKSKKVVGSNFIKKNGGKILYAETLEGFSTTNILSLTEKK